MLSDGKIVNEERSQDVQALIQNAISAKTKSPNELSPTAFFRNVTDKSPAGIKNHMYTEHDQEFTTKYITKWRGIFRGLGMSHCTS